MEAYYQTRLEKKKGLLLGLLLELIRSYTGMFPVSCDFRVLKSDFFPTLKNSTLFPFIWPIKYK